MKKLITASAIGALLTAGAAVAMQTQAPAAPTAKAPMTKAQMLARADAQFTALDTNKDGQLSAEERKAGFERARTAMAERRGGDGPRAERRGGGRMGQAGDRMLSRVDTNKDGLISRAEHRAAAEARFDRMDANKNGTIDAGERRGPGGKHMGKRMGKRGGGMMMMGADANKDGVITRAEFDAASAKRFERMDRNKDGKIDSADRPQRKAPSATPSTPGA